MEAEINGASRPHPQPSREDEGDDLQHSNILSHANATPPRTPTKVSNSLYNAQAARSNGRNVGAVGGVPDSEDPEDFYRTHSGSHSQNQNDITILKPTTSATQGSPASLRSNGNGTTPKYPSVSAGRTAIKSPNRSSPAQSDSKMSLNTAKSSPSLNSNSGSQPSRVKELAKHFNHQSGPGVSNFQNAGLQKGGVQTSNRSRAPTAPGITKPGGMSRVNATRSESVGEKQPVTASARLQKVQSPSQRGPSNPTATNTSQAVRSRAQVAGNRQASQSMTNLSPESSPKSPSSVKRKPLLFGELADGISGSPAVGYGIPQNVPRRTSDSSFLPLPVPHQNNQSDADVSPSSPTAWYRGALDEPDANRTPRPFQAHKRSQSESSSTKFGERDPSPRDSPSPYPRVDSPSRLPVSSKRVGNPSALGSSPHTYNRSPPTAKALPVISGKLQKSDTRPFSPPGRAITPIRATTPVQRSPNRHVPSPGKLSTGNSTLKAYISAPPPKLSPPLRSSRPRQPISTAATTTKPSGTAAPAKHPHGSKSTRSETLSPKSSSKQSNAGPIDFAARRAHINKNLSMRIQEAERREIQEAAARRAAAQKSQMEEDKANSGNQRSFSSEAEPPQKTSEGILTVNTSLKSPVRSHIAYLKAVDTTEPESPILGIPGSFPESDDVPVSAISNVTAFTEFEAEPQTEPPQRKDSTPLQSPLSRQPTEKFSDSHIRYSDPAKDRDQDGSINILLDTITPTDIDGDQEEPNSKGHKKSLTASTVLHDPYEDDSVHQAPQLLPKEAVASHDFPTLHWNHGEDHYNEKISHGERVLPDYSMESLRQHLQLDDDDDGHSQGSFDDRLYPSDAGELSKFESDIDNSEMGGQNGFQRVADTSLTDKDVEAPGGFYDQNSETLRMVDPTMRVTTHEWRNIQNAIDYSNRFAHQEYLPPLPPLPAHDRVPPPPPKIGPQVPPKSPTYSPQPSPSSTWDAANVANSPRTSNADQFQRPSSSGAEATTLPRLDTNAPPLPPPYSPPPPPQPGQMGSSITPRKRSPPPASFHNRRPVSGLNLNLNRSTTRESDSRRGSGEDLYSGRPSISSPRSNSQMSMDQDSFSRQASVDEQSRSTTLEDTDTEASIKERRALRHRHNVIKELIDTESLYLKDMNVVEEIYKGTAEACPKLQPSDIKTIFRNTDKVIEFSTKFLDDLKAASAAIYTPRSQRSRQSRITDSSVATDDALEEVDSVKDRSTKVGAKFSEHIGNMHAVYADYLKGSEQASNRLQALQSDPAVTVWLTECNAVAKDLTAAWDLDALLVKPVQRITRYPLLLTQIKDATPVDHPDYEDICKVCQRLTTLLSDIDEQKKRIHTVNQIVGRRRKESDGRGAVSLSTFAKLVRRDKPGSSNLQSKEDEIYRKHQDRFGDDYLRLQVVLRDIEFYNRTVREYVTDFLRYLAAIELVVRIGPGPSTWPELESKWTRFSMSMREMGTHALKDHISLVHERVLGPIENLIQAYDPPRETIKHRNKRRQDYEKANGLKSQNKKVDDKLAQLSSQYEALNETLKLELPRLSSLTERLANMCLIQFVSIQTDWFNLWQSKMKSVLEENQLPSTLEDIVASFHRDFRYQEARADGFGIMNGAFLSEISKERTSQSTGPQPQSSIREDDVVYSRSNPPTFDHRSRGLSTTSDHSPSLPTPDFGRSHGGQFVFSPVTATPSEMPQFLTRDYPVNGHSKVGSGSSTVADSSITARTHSGRPSTSRSYESTARSRPSADSYEARRSPRVPGDYNQWGDTMANGQATSRPFSGMFNSAMPPDDVDGSRRSSRASSQDRGSRTDYTVMFLAASLFEFNISEKKEAGYPYLTYQAGEIFDVLAAKGEIWLARNQDDPKSKVGWIWSKHFAQLAMD